MGPIEGKADGSTYGFVVGDPVGVLVGIEEAGRSLGIMDGAFDGW